MEIRKNARAFLYLAPSLAIFGIFMFWPLARTFYLSFFEWNMVKPVKKFVGLGNYAALLTSPLTYKILGNTAAYILILLAVNFAAPYVLSFVLSVVIKKGKGLYKSAFFLPSVISLVVGSMIYSWILNPVSGPLALIAKALGLAIPIWSKTDGAVIVVLSVITSWKIFGYNFIIILGGVSGISGEVIEAARIDNVPLKRIFFDIVLPMSGATGVYLFVMTIVQGMQFVFTPIKILTQGGPNYASSNVIYHSYHELFVVYRTGVGSAFAMLTLVLFAFLLFLEFRFVEKRVYYES
ncbi:MAG: sugar ABC transporter permease [Synergistaceae bacterium]|jgi:sn-glycerol 3-phosphate transport system permease protein|nr:sugar ABC transporter permease [Synergistaceae bacterium]